MDRTSPGIDALPGDARTAFDGYLSSETHPDFKAFAANLNTGRWGWAAKYKLIGSAIHRALRRCGGTAAGCQIYAIGNTVVFGLSPDQINEVIQRYHETSPYRRAGYRDTPKHKALAASLDGPYGWSYGSESVENVLRDAKINCGYSLKRNQRPCEIYEIDGLIVSGILAADINRDFRQTRRRSGQFSSKLWPAMTDIRLSGVTSLRGTVGALNARGVKTGSGEHWNAARLYRELIISGIPYLEDAATVQKNSREWRYPDRSSYLNSLGRLNRMQGRYNDAESVHKQALAILEQSKARNHLEVANALTGLGDIEHDRGLHIDAEPFYNQALIFVENVLGSHHIEVAIVLDKLGSLYHSQSRYEEAERTYLRALEIKENLFGSKHLSVVETLVLLSELYITQKRYADAESLFRRMLSIWESALGSENPDFATSLENYAFVLKKIGQFDEARKAEARAETIRSKLVKYDLAG